MLKRLSTTASILLDVNRDAFVNQDAFEMVRHLTDSDQSAVKVTLSDISPEVKVTSSDISRVMAIMGRRGGRIGGKRRLITMTPEQRHKVAQKAAQARWAKNGEKA